MAETAKIRVNVEVIELEVNDNGDTIKLPVSDEMFMKRLYDFIDRVSEESKKLDNLDLEDIAGTIEKDIQFHEMMKEQFNILFGDLAYEKVFGSDIIEVCPINENLFKNCLKLFSFARTKERELYPIIFLTSSIESASVPPETGVANYTFK